MPISVEWGNVEQTIISLTFVTPWTWDEFYEMHNQVATLTVGVDYVVDTLVDVSKGRSLPPNALTHLSKGASKIPPNQGIIAAVGVDAFIRSMMDMVIARSPHLKGKFQMVSNLDEGYKRIAEVQASRSSGV
jgi:hypothetical protein